jgi:hypothetical protein
MSTLNSIATEFLKFLMAKLLDNNKLILRAEINIYRNFNLKLKK